MWTCPKCSRNFQKDNQSHICTDIDIGELFIDKPDNMVLAFDDIVQVISHWQPNTYGPSVHSIVFTSEKAWLIIKPMKSELDVKFYFDSPLESSSLKKVTEYKGKYAHHIRVKSPDDITEEVINLLKTGHEYSIK